MASDERGPTNDVVRRPGLRASNRVEQLGLGHLFVLGSKSHKVAERLLDGDPHTRKELSQAEGLAASSVTRVVDTLQANGVRIERDRSQQRDAVYQAVSVPNTAEPSNSWSFVAPGEKGPRMRLANMNYAGDEGKVELTITGPLGRIRGVGEMVSAIAELAREGLPLTRVTLVEGGAQDWMLGPTTDPVVIRNVQWVTD